MGILGHGGGRQEGVENWPEGGGIRIFPAGGEARIAPGGGRMLYNCKKNPENALFQGVLEICSKYV